MHVKSLKVFCDVVGKRSFSRAADENGISQSGASQLVQQLEERLGVKLIDRSKRPFVLTPEGEFYYAGCHKLVRRLFALEEEVRALHTEVAGRVSVASIYSVGLVYLNDFVREFTRRYPRAKVCPEFQHPQRVYELVEQGQVNLGLVSYPKGSRTVSCLPWCEEPMVLACSPRHPWATRSAVAAEELDGRELISFTSDLRIRQETDRTLAACGVEVRTIMEFDNIETLKRAVEVNQGLSILPEPSIRREVELGILAGVGLEGVKLVRPLGIIHRRGVPLANTVQRFMELILESGQRNDEGRSADGTDQVEMAAQ